MAGREIRSLVAIGLESFVSIDVSAVVFDDSKVVVAVDESVSIVRIVTSLV